MAWRGVAREEMGKRKQKHGSAVNPARKKVKGGATFGGSKVENVAVVHEHVAFLNA